MVEYSEYSVKLRSKERVAAAEHPEKHVMQLSNLDLLLPPVDVGVFLCFEKPTERPFAAVAGDLKVSLARTLSTYYPFSGEVVVNSHGEPELRCNNHGVDFFDAYMHVELRELDLRDLGVSVEKKLVPTKLSGVLCVQVTELKCGGVVVACAFDHRIADAYSANMFLLTWAEISTTKPISHTPCFNKSTLSSPPSPGHHCLTTFDFDRLYVNASTLPPPPPAITAATTATRLYYLRCKDIHRIHAEASRNSYTPSKLESFCAFLWRSVKTCKLGVAVDGRRRISFLPDNYFGNVISLPFGELQAEDLSRKNLSEIAEAVGSIVRSAANEEHFLGLIEWVEKQRPGAAVVAKAYIEKSAVVSSGLRFQVTELDFGWGSPAMGSYHLPPGGGSAYVMPMRSSRREGDWVLYVYMEEELLATFEAAAGDVLRPITPEYLGLV